MSSTKTRVTVLASAAATLVVIAASWAITAAASSGAPLPQEPQVQYVGRLTGSVAVQYANLDDLRMASTSVVHVRAAQQHTFTPAGLPPYTMVEANVLELLSGKPVPATVTVRQTGGPQYVMDYPWSQIMTPGREYIVFLADVHATDGHYALTGGAYERQENGTFTLHEPALLPAAASFAELRSPAAVGTLAPAIPTLTGCLSGVKTTKAPALAAVPRTARQTLDAIGATPGDRRAGVTMNGWQIYTIYNQAEKPVAAYVLRLGASGAGAVLTDAVTCR